MLTSFKKIALGTTLLAASASSFANLPFTVDATAASGHTSPIVFDADNIAGVYNEVVVTNSIAGTFDATVLLDFNAFTLNGSAVANTALAPSFFTGVGYRLYAIVNFSGSVTSGTPNFSTGGWAGTIEMWLDPQFDTPSGQASSITALNTTVGTVGAGSNDDLLFDAAITFGQSNGTTLSASFSLDGDLSADPGSDPSLTPAGSAFFVAPNPFYNMVASFGLLNDFFEVIKFDGTEDGNLQRFDSGANVNFVPTPSGLGLLGLGLFALAYRARKA